MEFHVISPQGAARLTVKNEEADFYHFYIAKIAKQGHVICCGSNHSDITVVLGGL